MGLIVRKHKKKKSARQKTDENILGLVYAVVCCFCGLWHMWDIFFLLSVKM